MKFEPVNRLTRGLMRLIQSVNGDETPNFESDSIDSRREMTTQAAQDGFFRKNLAR
jgi:hypothetical protein